MGAAIAGETRTTCPYCGVGCGIIVSHAADRITGVRGDPAHPANFGRLCSKGQALPLTLAPAARALHPEARPGRDTERSRASWEAALAFAAHRFARSILDHGPDSVAFYISGQLLTEDYYAFNKLAKGLVGTNNVDTNSRLCMSSAVAGYKVTLGADAPPACYEDLDHAACVFIAGANMAWAHPVLYRRLEAARRANPAMKVIVADPRRTDTAQEASLHLPLAPGSDVALFHAMLHVAIAEARIDRAYIARATEGFEALEALVRECTPAWAARICELPEADIVAAARLFAASPATLSLYCQGLNQSASGTAKNAALVNLHLATAQIGRPGAGPFSLTGQPNAMGGREVGGMANLLSAHRDLASAADRAEVARFWGVESVPAERGKTAVELFDALAEGSVRCVWIACTNPAQSMPDQARVRAALQRAECVVVQDCYRDIETAAWADVLLPASTWGEKDGTVTNSERRISRVRSAIAAPGEAWPDWKIAVEFARRLGPLIDKDAASLFPYACAEEIFDEHRESTRGRDLDITGLSYRLLERDGPQQWPYPQGASAGRARLYEDGRFATPSGRARFAAVPLTPCAEPVSAARPLNLLTGRLRDQWHGMSRTGRAASLFDHEPAPALEMNPGDMRAHGLGEGDVARVSSARGAVALPVRASQTLRPGDCFLAMHWGSRFLRGEGVNAVTNPAIDPRSFQPELKHAAVAVERVATPWRLAACALVGDADAALAALQEHFAPFDYASCTLAGGDYPMVAFHAAGAAAPPAATIAAIDRVLGLDDAQRVMAYDDPATGDSRRARRVGQRLAAFRLAGDVRGAAWLAEWLGAGHPVMALGHLVLAPADAPPAGAAARGRVVCVCHGVGEAQIAARLAAGASLDAIRAELKCGTGCGSCVPELKRLEAARVPGAAALAA